MRSLPPPLNSGSRNPSATLSEIAARAGVGRASLHRYFKGRDDLIRAVTDQCMRETEAATLAAIADAVSAEERLICMLRAVIPLGDRYHFLATLHLDDPYLKARYEAETQWMAQLVEALKEEAVIDVTLPTAWVSANIDMQIWLAWSAVAKDQMTADDAAALSIRTLLAGMGPQKEASRSHSRRGSYQ